MESITNPMCAAASPWGLGMSPIAQLQGSGLPFAGYVVTDAATAKPRHTVPDPRGRLR